MKKVLALVLSVVLVLSFVACGSDDSNNGGDKKPSIVGTWKAEDSSSFYTEISFGSDGKGSMETLLNVSTSFEYTDKDGKVELYEVGKTGSPVYIYEYTINDNKLTLKDTDTGSSEVYIKK